MPKKTSSKRKKLLIAAAITASGALIYIAIPKNESADKASDTSSLIGVAPKTFHGIPAEGIGGDPDLNRAKNRWSAPATITEMTVAEIKALPHDGLETMGKKDRNKWTASVRAQALASESRGVRVIGYLAGARESGSEACNGKSDQYHDFHLWLTDEPGINKRNGIVVEMTPFWNEQFASWQLKEFSKAVTHQTKVRVTGWILWDEEHGDEVGKSRGSLWEIHPITEIEVFSGGKWVQFGAAANP